MTSEPTTNDLTGITAGLPPTREVAAASLLTTMGMLGVFVPIGIVAFRSLVSFSSGHGSEQPPLGRLAESIGLFVSTISLLSVVAIVAGAGLYQRRRWGRVVGLIVAGLLIASAPIWLLFTNVAPGGSAEDLPVGWAVLRHPFGIYDGNMATAPVNLFVGSVVAWGLITRPGGVAPVPPDGVSRSARRPRRLGVLMGLLVIFGLDAFLPYMAWLGGPLRPMAELDESGQAIAGDAATWDWTAGIAVFIASFVACAVALAAARSIRSRRTVGPYLAPAAAAVSATWAAVWVFLAGATLGAVEGPASILSLPLYALALVALLAFPFALWAVLSRRDWFSREGRRATAVASVLTRPRPTPSPVVAVPALVLFAPVAVLAAAWLIDPPPEPIDYRGVLFDERAYHAVAPLVDVEDAVVSVGVLSAWSEELREVVSDPTVYAFADTPADQAIAIRATASTDYGGWPFVLFVRTDDGRIPGQLCRFVPIEDPIVSAVPCGPPGEVVLNSRGYVRTEGFEVGPGDLTRLDVLATTPEPSDARVDLTAYAIRDVPTEGAIALRLGARTIVYQSDPKVTVALELCRYSPGAIADPLGDTSHVPYGCGLPSGILVDGVHYSREDKTDELLAVPASALSARGTAVAVFEEGRPAPFPPTIDDTAYVIDGVAPADGIALKVRDRVIVMRPNDTGGGLPVPASLCRYVVPEAAARMETEGEGPVGCP